MSINTDNITNFTIQHFVVILSALVSTDSSHQQIEIRAFYKQTGNYFADFAEAKTLGSCSNSLNKENYPGVDAIYFLKV